MKRTAMLTVLGMLLAIPSFLPAEQSATRMEVTASTELPWVTVQAVFKKVEARGHYTYQQLVDGYSLGLITVQQSGSSYLVSIYNADGIVDMIIIDEL